MSKLREAAEKYAPSSAINWRMEYDTNYVAEKNREAFQAGARWAFEEMSKEVECEECRREILEQSKQD